MHESRQAIAPRDLLPLGVGAAMVADGHLVDPAAKPGHLGGDLGCEPEAGRPWGLFPGPVGTPTPALSRLRGRVACVPIPRGLI